MDHYLSESTRKRKLTTDKYTRRVSKDGISLELNVANDQENPLPSSVDSVSFRVQPVKDEGEEMNKSCLGILHQSFQQKGPSLLNESLFDESLNVSLDTLSGFQISLNQTKSHVVESLNIDAEKSQTSICLQDVMTSGQKNDVLQVSQSNISCSGLEGYLHEKSCVWDVNNSNAIAISDVSAVRETLSGDSSCIEQDENNRPLKNYVETSSASVAAEFRDGARVNDDGHGTVNVLIRNKTDGAEMSKSRHSLEQKISHRDVNSYVKAVVKDDKRNDTIGGSFESPDDKSNSNAGKLSPIVAEKLWDGSLQLNSSVTVSATASFKSGEKMPYHKWPNFIEVKGKVRLEAFEKYIQDLPRSRNRGLMVISLHCKEGSSKSRLAGMKEVAKGYKKRERVGFAQLSQGIDLYVCPHTDTIITLFAKHGFFKGRTAVEDNQDSLIGCVVWRRNRASADSVVKKSEMKKNHSLVEQAPNSSSDFSGQKVYHKVFPHIQPEPEIDCKNIGSVGNTNVECKCSDTNQMQPELLDSSTSANLSLISSVLGNSSSKGLQISSTSDTIKVPTILGKTLQVKVPLIEISKGKPKTTAEVHRTAVSFPSGTKKEPLRALDVDDLPEFDFRAACGISLTPKTKLIDAAIVEKKLPAENFMRKNRSLLSMIPSIRSMPASNKRALEDFGFRTLPLDPFERIPLQSKVCPNERTIFLPHSEEKHATRSTIRPSTTASPPLKNLFDDDDDMPEWYPPDAKLHRLAVSETARLSTATVSKVLHSTSESFPRDPLSHPFPSPPPHIYLPFLPQKLHWPMNQNVKPVLPRPCNEDILQGPNSLMGFSSKPLFRPPISPFDVKLPVRSDDGKLETTILEIGRQNIA